MLLDILWLRAAINDMFRITRRENIYFSEVELLLRDGGVYIIDFGAFYRPDKKEV